MTAEIIKLPYSVTRGAHSRKPRRSKNGTPRPKATATVTQMPGTKKPPCSPAFREFVEQLSWITPEEFPAFIARLRKHAGLMP